MADNSGSNRCRIYHYLVDFNFIKFTMKMLRIIIHNKIKNPVYIEVEIPVELSNAIKFSPVTHCEFLIFDKDAKNIVHISDGKSFKIPPIPKGNLDDFKINLGR